MHPTRACNARSAIADNCRPLHTIGSSDVSRNAMNDRRNGLTYAQAGVDIDAGNRMVELIKPLVRATRAARRRRRDRRLRRPVRPQARRLQGPGAGRGQPTASAPRSRSRSRPAATTRSASISSPCASTTSSCRAPSRCSSSTISPPASSTPEIGAAGRQGHRRGLPRGRLRADRRRDRGDAGPLSRAATTISPASRSARPSAARLLPRGDIAAGDVVLGLASSACIPTASRWCARSSTMPGLRWDAPAPFAPRQTLGEALLDADPHLREAAARGDPRNRRRSRRWRTSPAAAFPTTSRACCPKASARASISRRVPVPPVFRWLAQTGGVAEAEMLRTFNCGIGMIAVGRAARGRCGRAVLKREGETRRAARRASSPREGKPRVVYAGHLDLAG